MYAILALKPYRPDKPKDNTWIERSKRAKQGTYNYSGGEELPEGTFTKSAGQIVQTLKSKSKDYKQAMSRLSGYINMQGDNLSSSDISRLEQAKESLKRAYGVQESSSRHWPLGTKVIYKHFNRICRGTIVGIHRSDRYHKNTYYSIIPDNRSASMLCRMGCKIRRC